MKNIVEIAQELINSGAISSNDFQLTNNEIVPKDDYTRNFIVSEIKGLGHDCIVKGGKIVLTGETVSEVVEAVVETKIDGVQTLTEVKNIPGDIERAKESSDLRRLIEDLYNKAEDTVFAFGEYQDSGSGEAKGYLLGLQNVVASLGVLKNKMNGTHKPLDPSSDF